MVVHSSIRCAEHPYAAQRRSSRATGRALLTSTCPAAAIAAERATMRAAVIHSAAWAAQAPHYCIFQRSLAAFSQLKTEVCFRLFCTWQYLTTLVLTSSRRAAADSASPKNHLRRNEIGCDTISLHATYRPVSAKPTRTRSCNRSDGVLLQWYSSSRSSSACGARFKNLEHCSSQRGSK
jgi:hypothetical protein